MLTHLLIIALTLTGSSAASTYSYDGPQVFAPSHAGSDMPNATRDWAPRTIWLIWRRRADAPTF